MLLARPLDDIDIEGLTIPADLLTASIQAFNRARTTTRNDTLKIPEFMPPEVWVTKNIKLKTGMSQNEGWLEFTGYQRAMARAFMDEECADITALKGTRVGWSLFIAAMTAYFVGYLGEAVTIAQPTEQDAEEYFKEVIEPMIECCEVLKDQLIPGAWYLLQFKSGGSIRLVGAASDDSFRRYGSKRNIGDEYSGDGWAKKKGSQGEKADLFKERGNEYWHSTLAIGSSPLSKEECRTFARWENSDKRFPYVVCPRCERQQIMEWGDADSSFGFKWKCDETTGFVDEAWYQCVSGCKITENDKQALDASLEYIPTSVPTTPGHYGFHIPQWLSFAGKANWKNLAQRFVSAQGKPESLKTFTNNVRAWVWDEYTTSAMDAMTVSSLLKSYPAEVPDDVVVLTAGGDTQDNKEGTTLERQASREVSIVGWNALGQFRVIGHWAILGEPGDPEADMQLRELLNRPFYKRDGSKWFVQASAHDFGGQGYADAVRMFCNSFAVARNVWAIKGNAHRKDFVWPKSRSKSTSGTTYYTIDSHNARDDVFKLMQLVGDKEPFVPLSLGTGYLDKLMCQERVRKDGRWHWREKKGHRAEEEWMCLAYAYAALVGLKTSYKKWRSLNLAAESLRVPNISFDPQTGELGCDSVDKSAMAMRVEVQIVQDAQAKAKPQPSIEQKVHKVPDRPAAAEKSGGELVRKRRRGGIIR